jgi:aspartate racemase
MRTIGLIGGMSWESTALYYRIINREVGTRLGGLRSAPLLMQSLDFEEVVARQKAGAWGELAATLADAGRRLERAGAECLLIGTNTMHRVAAEVEAAVSIPLLHIADAAVAQHEAIVAIGRVVRRQASVMAYSDVFLLMGAGLIISLIAALALKKAVGGSAAGAH